MLFWLMEYGLYIVGLLGVAAIMLILYALSDDILKLINKLNDKLNKKTN